MFYRWLCQEFGLWCLGHFPLLELSTSGVREKLSNEFQRAVPGPLGKLMWIQPLSTTVTQKLGSWTWLDTFCGKFEIRQDPEKHIARGMSRWIPSHFENILLRATCFKVNSDNTKAKSLYAKRGFVYASHKGVQHWLFWPSRTWRRDAAKKMWRALILFSEVASETAAVLLEGLGDLIL